LGKPGPEEETDPGIDEGRSDEVYENFRVNEHVFLGN